VLTTLTGAFHVSVSSFLICERTELNNPYLQSSTDENLSMWFMINFALCCDQNKEEVMFLSAAWSSDYPALSFGPMIILNVTINMFY
jgi:hypothetical protein